jgi:hypothetical protein
MSCAGSRSTATGVHDWEDAGPNAEWCRRCGALVNSSGVHLPTYAGLPIVAGLLADKPTKTELTQRASEAETQLRAEGNIT